MNETGIVERRKTRSSGRGPYPKAYARSLFFSPLTQLHPLSIPPFVMHRLKRGFARCVSASVGKAEVQPGLPSLRPDSSSSLFTVFSYA